MSLPQPHIGLNAHLLSSRAGYRSAGIHGYIAELLQRLPAANINLRYTAFVSQAAAPLVRTVPVRAARWSTERPLARIAHEQFILPGQVARARLALLHGLAFVSPLACPCPTVVTVHDLSFALFPEYFRGPNGLYLRLMTRISCRRAAHVIALSENTRADLLRLYGLPAERVTAVPNGVGAAFYPRPCGERAEFKRTHKLPESFILFVDTLEPRKNLVALVKAFAILHARHSALKLILVGGKGWYHDQIFGAVERLGLEDQVVFAGYVPDADLPLWYNAASVFAFPSRYEGFGFPVLEALACGLPTITSTAASLPEVAGDAALLVPPDDVSALADALHRALTDGALRQELSAQGPARAAQFTWEAAARRTASIYQQVLS